MPRNYKRTTTRQSWSEVNMEKAIKLVLEGSMGYLKASKIHSVPQSTLEDRVKKARRGLLVEKASKKAYMGGFKTVFTPDQERKLVDQVLVMESRLFGFTMAEVRTLAYDLAVREGIRNKFDSKKKMAGEDWLHGFLKRHTELTIRLRNRGKSSVPRAMGFNRVAVANFFHILESLFEKYKFSPLDIYNVADIGITTVSNKPSKIIALRGRRQIGTLTSADRQEVLVTTEICMSAAGIFMPTMFVFPCKNETPELLRDALPGSTAEYHETGSMQKDLFVKWFKQFIRFANPSTDKPVLLLLDGQTSHTKSLELINLANDNNVILLSLPPNCTDKMQPLDVTFIAPLSACYEETVQKWLTAHPGCYVTIHQVGKLFGSAFMTTAIMGTAINGFKKTGIYPLDPNIFPDHLYAQTADINDEYIEQNDLIDNFLNTNDTLWFPENSSGTENSEIITPQPSTSIDSGFVVQSENSGKRQAENDGINEENILICSPYKCELESAIADLTQLETRVSAKKRKLHEKSQSNEEKLTKKQQQEYNDTVGTTIDDESFNEEEKDL